MVNSKAMGDTRPGPTAIDITSNVLAIRFRKERLAHLTAEISRARDQQYILRCELERLEGQEKKPCRGDEYPHETLLRLLDTTVAYAFDSVLAFLLISFIRTINPTSLTVAERLGYVLLVAILGVIMIACGLIAVGKYFAESERIWRRR